MVFGIMTSLFGQISAAKKARRISSRGWGEKYRWLTLDEGMAMGNKLKKPVMVIVHSMSCVNCINLKKKFAKADSLVDYSDNFVMVNLDASEVPKDNSFAPDGFYVPRVLFFTPNGYLMRDVTNEFRNDLRFTYSDPAFVIDAMKVAIKKNKSISFNNV